jgi:hypothetical protein
MFKQSRSHQGVGSHPNQGLRNSLSASPIKTNTRITDFLLNSYKNLLIGELKIVFVVTAIKFISNPLGQRTLALVSCLGQQEGGLHQPHTCEI